MTEGMGSRPISSRQVYPQDTPPADNRPGVLWVDTSLNPPKTKVRDADAGTWEPVAPGNVTIGDTEPTGKNEGHLWVDTSDTPPTAKVLDSTGTWGLIQGDIAWRSTDTYNGISIGQAWNHFSISGSYDEYLFILKNADWTGADGIDMFQFAFNQSNGDGSHSYMQADGASVTSSGYIALFDAYRGISGNIAYIVDGTWNKAAGITPLQATMGPDSITNGNNDSVASPLTDIGFYAQGGTVTGDLEVYGR